jgi:hypothetical protein
LIIFLQAIFKENLEIFQIDKESFFLDKVYLSASLDNTQEFARTCALASSAVPNLLEWGVIGYSLYFGPSSLMLIPGIEVVRLVVKRMHKTYVKQIAEIHQEGFETLEVISDIKDEIRNRDNY